MEIQIKKKKRNDRSFYTRKNNYSSFSNISTFNTNKSILNSNKLISLKIKVCFLDKEIVINIEINKQQSVKNLKYFIIQRMNKYIFTEKEIKEKSNIMFDNEILESERKLKDIEDLENRDIVLEIDLKTIEDKIDQNSEKNSFTEKKSFCPENLLPVLTKIGYKIFPSLSQISRMSIDELKNIENLKIWNDHGKIEWEKADLTGQNLDLDIYIKPKEVEVYPDDIYTTTKKKPEVGTKLNRPCTITLFNMEPSTNQNKSKFERKLEELCQSQGSEFLNYDYDSKYYSFRVFHFTKYSFLDIDVDESESKESEELGVIEENNSFGEIKSKKSEDLDRSFEEDSDNREDMKEEVIEVKKSGRDIQKKRKEEELLDLLDKSQHLSFFNNKSSPEKKDLRSKSILKKREYDLKKNNFVAPVKNLPVYDQEENERIENEIKNLEDAYNNYQKTETEITTNKKEVNFNNIDKKVLKNFAFLNKIINNDKITKDSKHFYRTFDFPIKWIDNETVSILQKDNFFNTMKEKKIEFSKEVNLNEIFLIIKNVFSEIMNYQKKSKNSNLDKENFIYIFFINILNQFHSRELIEPYLFVLLINSIFGKNCVSFFKGKTFGKNIEEQLRNFQRQKKSNQNQSESEDYKTFYKKREFMTWLEKVIFLTLKIEKCSYNENNMFNLFLEEDIIDNDESFMDSNLEKLTSTYFKKLKDDYIIKQLLLFLKEERKNNLSLSDLYNKFGTQQNGYNNLDFFEIILLDVLKINEFIENKKYLENGNDIDSFIIGRNIIKEKKELHFFNLLFHNLLIIQTPEILQNKTFQKNYNWNFKMTHEISIQNKFYFSALTICSNFIIPSLIDKEGYENHTLNLILNYSDFNNNQLEKIISEFYNRKEIFTFKAFYNLVNLRYMEAIEDFCKIGKFEKGYKIFFNHFLSPFILEGKFEEIELINILENFERFNFLEKKETDLRENLICNFLVFLDLEKKHCLFNDRKNFENLVRKIYKDIKIIFEHEKNIWENNKEIFLTISSQVFKIISNYNKNDISEDVLKFIREDFVILLKNNEILPILKEEDKNNIIQGFLFLL